MLPRWNAVVHRRKWHALGEVGVVFAAGTLPEDLESRSTLLGRGAMRVVFALHAEVATMWSILKLILLIGVLGATEVRAQEARDTDRGVPVEYLEGRFIGNPAGFRFPITIAALASFVIVCDSEADTTGFVLEAKTGRLLGRFGPAGDGPNEVRAAVSIVPDSKSESAFWLIDGMLRRATRYSISHRGKAAAIVNADATVHFPTPESTPVFAGFVDQDQSFVVAGFFDGPRFARIDPAGRSMSPFGPAVPGPKREPARVRQHAFQSALARHPEGGRFAAATRYSDRLEVFGPTGQMLAGAERFRAIEPVYTVVEASRGPRMRPEPQMRQVFISLAADTFSVYALYSGRSAIEARAKSWLGSSVEEYTWTGQRKRVLALEEDALAIAVDPARRALYAIVPNRGVKRYDLPRNNINTAR